MLTCQKTSYPEKESGKLDGSYGMKHLQSHGSIDSHDFLFTLRVSPQELLAAIVSVTNTHRLKPQAPQAKKRRPQAHQLCPLLEFEEIPHRQRYCACRLTEFH